MTIFNVLNLNIMITPELQVFCQSLPHHRPIIAIDYGRKKIGIAVSDQNWNLALPIATEMVKANDHISIIKAYLKKYNAAALVMGVPVNMDGSDSEQTTSIKNFANALSKALPELLIFLQDERLTSKNAESLLRLGGMSRKQRQDVDDSVAASIILESVLQRMKVEAR